MPCQRERLGTAFPKGTAFKPALGELYKKHPVCIKIRLFEIQNRNFFLGRGTALPPLFANPGAPILFGSHTCFSRKRSLGTGSPVISCPFICLSVRPSVTLRYRGHIDWLTWKVITRIISLGPSLVGDPTSAN